MLLEELAATFDVAFSAMTWTRSHDRSRSSVILRRAQDDTRLLMPLATCTQAGVAARFAAERADYERVKARVNALSLHTVCKEAACPNMAECWGAGTATIMILGDMCTRGCRFCNVKTGNPRGEVDWLEPVRVAEAVRDLGWKYLVLTAVDRDDLPDGGALIFANTVREIHERVPGARVEILSGDYRGDLAALDIVMDAQARRLRAQSRNRSAPHAARARQARRATISRCAVLAHAKRRAPRALHEDVADARASARAEARSRRRWTMRARPASTSSRWASTCSRRKKHLPVVEFVTPERFERLGELGGEQRIPPGRLQPALAQFVPRRTSILTLRTLRLAQVAK